MLQCVAILAGASWLLAVLAYGFVARVATGPTLSPLGLLVTRGIRPRLPLPPRPVPGPPKRFAQGIGAVLAATAAVLHLGWGLSTAATVLTGAILVAATLESALGVCVGCWLFARLMAAGLIPDRVCAACLDITRRSGSAA